VWQWEGKRGRFPVPADVFIEGILEVKLPTIWTDEKQRWEESEKRREGVRNQKQEPPTKMWGKILENL